MKRAFGVSVLIAILFPLSSLLAQPWPEMPEIFKAKDQARKDARKDVNEVKWVIIGCTSLIVGVNNAKSSEIPPPNPERFLGKSREYIVAYEEAYYKQVRTSRFTYSLVGCFSGTVIYAVVIIQGVRYTEQSSNEAYGCCAGNKMGGNSKFLFDIFKGCCL